MSPEELLIKKQKAKQYWLNNHYAGPYREFDEHFNMIYKQWPDGDYRYLVYHTQTFNIFCYNYYITYDNSIEFMNIICK